MGPITFQASELAKLASIIFVAWWFSKFEAKCKGLLMGLIYPVAVVVMLLIPILLETDLGNDAADWRNGFSHDVRRRSQSKIFGAIGYRRRRRASWSSPGISPNDKDV